MKLSIYAKFARLLGISPSSVEADSDLKLLAELHAEFLRAKKSEKQAILWRVAFPIANYPEFRKHF